jgi:hypothetical protein
VIDCSNKAFADSLFDFVCHKYVVCFQQAQFHLAEKLKLSMPSCPIPILAAASIKKSDANHGDREGLRLYFKSNLRNVCGMGESHGAKRNAPSLPLYSSPE